MSFLEIIVSKTTRSDGFFSFDFAFWGFLIVERACFSLLTEIFQIGTELGGEVLDERGHFVGGFAEEHAVVQAEINFGTGTVIQRSEPNGSGLVHVAVDRDPSKARVAKVVNDVGRPLEIFFTDCSLVFEGLGIDLINLINVLEEFWEIRRGAH